MKRTVYFDNAATSFPKPEGVAEAVYDYIKNNGSNINRSSYSKAYEAENAVLETRSMLKSLFNAPDESNVIFTSGDTMSLNMVTAGLAYRGGHFITSSYEHNAVMRPLVEYAERGLITFDRVNCSEGESLKVSDMERLLKKETTAVIITHASNVCGTVLPIAAIGGFCHSHGLYFIVDAAQTAGSLDIDVRAMNIDALCFPGHKGLMGPQGVGGMILSGRLAERLGLWVLGGTGSVSHLETMPDFLPDRFEAGTLNIPGIMGLNASLKYILRVGTAAIREHERELTERFIRGVSEIDGVHPVGAYGDAEHAPVVSLVFDNMDAAEAAYILEDEFGILTRVGLHCAPAAHRALGTYPGGTVRFSFGFFNTREEIDYGIEAIGSICKRG